MGCLDCGAPTPRRRCKTCARAARDGDEVRSRWDPEPAELRDGETRDDDNTHARRNAAMQRMADEFLEDDQEGDRQ